VVAYKGLNTKEKSSWVIPKVVVVANGSGRYTVITPPRYNAPDMTPPTTRHKERGIFTTGLKNEAAYFRVIMVFSIYHTSE